MRRNLFLLGLFVFLSSHAQNQIINGSLTAKDQIFVGEDVSGKWGEGTRLNFKGIDLSGDHFWLAKYTAIREFSDLRVNIGDNFDDSDRFVIGTTHWQTKEFREWFHVRSDGNVGIGIAQPTSKLAVNGTIRAKAVRIEITGWSDFVFAEDYKLPTLMDVEKHIKENKHLPDIPSESDVIENGISVGEMQAKLLQKIEELTLYVIGQEKEIQSLKEENTSIRSKLLDLKK